jgi:hypothetical protein
MNNYAKESSAYRRMLLRCSPGGDLQQQGIKVCERWADYWNGFQNFIADIGPCQFADHALGRLDVSQDFTPENTRWLPPVIYTRNRKEKPNTALILLKGKEVSLNTLAKHLGANYTTLYKKLVMEQWTLKQTLEYLLARRADPYIKPSVRVKLVEWRAKELLATLE